MTARELQRQTEKSMKFHITEALQRLSNRREYGRLGTRGAGIEAHGVDWRGCGGTKPMRDGDWGLGVGDWGLGGGGGGGGEGGRGRAGEVDGTKPMRDGDWGLGVEDWGSGAGGAGCGEVDGTKPISPASPASVGGAAALRRSRSSLRAWRLERSTALTRDCRRTSCFSRLEKPSPRAWSRSVRW